MAHGAKREPDDAACCMCHMPRPLSWRAWFVCSKCESLYCPDHGKGLARHQRPVGFFATVGWMANGGARARVCSSCGGMAVPYDT